MKNSLERLLHNTEESYFFVPESGHPHINADYCVFLKLSVALKAIHYQVLVDAKVAQLADVFQAKVGWLTGNMYSRVGTPDLEEFEDCPQDIKAKFFDETLYKDIAWLTSSQLSRLKESVKVWKRENPGKELTVEVATRLIQSIPTELEILAERAASQLKERQLLAQGQDVTERVAQLLKNDKVIKRIVDAK